MAYAFSKEGAAAYRQLAKNIQSINSEIVQSGNKLKSEISQFNFADMQSQVDSLTEAVVASAVSGTSAVEMMSAGLNELATKMEAICGSL